MWTVLIFAPSAHCHAGILSPEEKNFSVLTISAGLDFGVIGAIHGISAVDSIDINGTYDAAGLSSNLSGVYLGNALGISYSGSLDPGANIGTWNASGNYGANTVNSSGTALFSTGDSAVMWSESGSVGASSWTLSGPLSVASTNGSIHLFGDFAGTINNQSAIVSIDLETDWVVRVIILISTLPALLNHPYHFQGMGSGDPPIGPVTGSIRAVPEPSSLLLIAIGGLGGLSFIRFQRSRRSNQVLCMDNTV